MTDKNYINTDVNITLTPRSEDPGFVMADVASASVTFAKVDGTASLTLTSATAAVTIGASNIIVKIPDTSGISTAGVYIIQITIVDTSGNLRGLTPDIEYITFY